MRSFATKMSDGIELASGSDDGTVKVYAIQSAVLGTGTECKMTRSVRELTLFHGAMMLKKLPAAQTTATSGYLTLAIYPEWNLGVNWSRPCLGHGQSF
jgi:hypothetical protein